MIKETLRQISFVRKAVDRYRRRKLIREWEQVARNGYSPHLVKQRAVREYAERYRTRILVETGTCLGEMVYAMKGRFARIFSIELDQELWRGASSLFAGDSHVSILQGDSGEKLTEVLAQLREPALFWLDAHYSGGITARGAKDTPIGQEMEMILSHSVTNHVVLIDDARNFVGNNDYPTQAELKELVYDRRADFSFVVADDIIQICPPTGL